MKYAYFQYQYDCIFRHHCHKVEIDRYDRFTLKISGSEIHYLMIFSEEFALISQIESELDKCMNQP